MTAPSITTRSAPTGASRIENVPDYRDRRASVRREKLDELTRLSEELEGGYQ